MVVESDDWRDWGDSILAPEILRRVEKMLQVEGALLLEHRFYRGARGPEMRAFYDFDEFLEYVRDSALPGDKFYLWSANEVCREDNRMAICKCPDARGRTPKTGAY
jgi:hypothetical protein